MRSLLTKGVFRRILSDQPIVLHRNPSHAHPRQLLNRHGRSALSPIQRRYIFGFWQQKPKRDLREPHVDPGMDKMLQLDRKLHMVSRLPPEDELASAFRDFLQAKQKQKLPIEDFHALQILQTLKVLEDSFIDGKGEWLSKADLGHALIIVDRWALHKTQVHNSLARRLFSAFDSRNESFEPPEAPILALINVLVETGSTKDARDILTSHGEQRKDFHTETSWTKIVQGYAKENNEQEFLSTLETVKSKGIPVGLSMQRSVAFYYARKNDVQRTKEWFTPAVLNADDGQLDEEAYRSLLEFCLRNGELDWGQGMLDFPDAPEKTWRAIFGASAAAGKSVEEIDRMISVMMRRKAQEQDPERSHPDISIFNALISAAVAKNDAYTAERYSALAEKWGAEPNAQTFILQVSYRLMAKDFDGAQAAYRKLRNQPIVANEDWETMNQLTQALTALPGIANETVMSLVADISERKRLFPANTVAALCSYHLQRDEYFELVDLLQTYAYQYSISDRTFLRDLLAATALNPATDTARVWDTYMIFHQVFDFETKRNLRVEIMKTMFSRGRPDLATHVFTKMARHARADTRPDAYTYTAAFEGIANTAEPEALEVIHNMLKLDTETEPNTKLLNALMLAYNACGAPHRALEIWEQIATSVEGPSYASLHAAFRACEGAPFGYRTANAIWERLERSDVSISRELLASYVGALSGNKMFKDCGEIISRMAEITGSEPDEFILGTFFNAAFGVSYQEQIQEWAVEKYPELWQTLEARGLRENALGMRHIPGIDRSLRP